MKKLILAGAMALAIAFAAPAMADDASGLQTLVDNATAGSTITLDKNYTLTDAVNITKNITINGAGYTVTGVNNSHVFNITADANDVALNNVVITASGTGYGINANGKNLDVTDCVINASNRGMTFYPTNGQDATLSVSDTEIYNTDVTDYDTNAKYGDNRGISVSNVTSGNVDIDTCQIYGFGYSLNLVNDPGDNGLRDSDGTVYDITNSVIKGWSALNLWAADADINFTNCTLMGINRLDGSWNGFSAIRANDGIYGGRTDKETVITIKGGTVASKQYGTALQTPFTVDQELQTKFDFEKNGRTNVKIDIYTVDSTAYIFCFFPGVDGEGYVASSKVEGYPGNCDVSAISLLESNMLQVSSAQSQDDVVELLDAQVETETGGDVA